MAKIALIDYLRRTGKKNRSSDEIDPDKVFEISASRGDIESFRQLVEYYTSNDPDHQTGWNPVRSLADAALHGQWDMIEFIVGLDPDNEDAPEYYTAMIESAIKGGHLHILEKCKDHPQLAYLVRELDIEFMEYCITRGRHAMLNFLLEQQLESEYIKHILDVLAYSIYENADPVALESIFTRFPQFRNDLSEHLRKYVGEIFEHWRFLRPSTGLSSSTEFMPDDVLWANLYKMKNMIS